MSIFCGSKSTIKFQDSAPFPWPIYNVVLNRLSITTHLTDDLRTPALPGMKLRSIVSTKTYSLDGDLSTYFIFTKC